MSLIILTTLNAKYQHSSLGLRYLMANMEELVTETKMMEFTINIDSPQIVESLLANTPQIVGFGIYIWNAQATLEVIKLLKAISPHTVVILGGPQSICAPTQICDYIIQGEGDTQFATLCRKILNNETITQKIFTPAVPDLSSLKLPYHLYSNEDIQHRYLYLETTRGCPYRCEFCLSSIDKEVRNFNLDLIFAEIEKLLARGGQHFKFVDRTFNLDLKRTKRILQFFLARINQPFFLHFEMNAENFDEELFSLLGQFPPQKLQLEIGIQTFNPNVASEIKRPLNIEVIKTNITRLISETKAHLHTDLIAGLPGEDLVSFAKGFNQLVQLAPHEIQLGILKKLGGTAIARHDGPWQMIYNSDPPYDLLQNKLITFPEMQKLKRFARFWDLFYNRHNFNNAVAKMLGDDPFGNFQAFCQYLENKSYSPYAISLTNQARVLYQYMRLHFSDAEQLISSDLAGRSIPFTSLKSADHKKTVLHRRQKRTNQ